MRLHRFFVGEDTKLTSNFWLHDEKLLWQWTRVLRFRSGQEVRLFNNQAERLYKISELSKKEAHLKLITEMQLQLPTRHVYLFWSLLKKENNEYILQKCSEIGVSNFVPLLSERTIKKDFNYERAQKIVIEASEQCGRGNIPVIRQPVHLNKAIEEYKDKVQLLVCEQGKGIIEGFSEDRPVGILVGPEGGWSEAEQELFATLNLSKINLADFTLRAETAAIVAASKLL